MSAHVDIVQDLVANGWMHLDEHHENQVLYFRWFYEDGDQIREEISILFDKQGRVKAWTVWHNKRFIGPDQEVGTRRRLNVFIAD